jgi:alanyl-tRNA synthetase
VAGDRFEGYTTTTVKDSHVLALFDAARHQVSELPAGSTGFVVLDVTPFYLESGGQVSDVGTLRNEAGTVLARVTGVLRLGPGLPRAHRVQVEGAPLIDEQAVAAVVDDAKRDATRRNHTATHLLHAALRQTLGTHVKQAGSLVAPDRLRFDFTHFAAVTAADLAQIEETVNQQVLRNAAVTTDVRSTEDAIAGGAMALFGEKYGDHVRVVTIPGFSVELCGGTHVRATGDIGLFTVTEESGVAAGVRRIEALTGEGALHEHQARRAALRQVLSTLSVGEEQAVEAIAKLQMETKRLLREVQDLKVKAALGGGPSAEAPESPLDIGGVSFVVRRVDNLDREALRQLSDHTRDRLKTGGVVLVSAGPENRVTMVSSVTADLKGRFHAGNIVKALAPLVGGKGGGRPDFAEAGGSDPAGIDALLAQAPTVIAGLDGLKSP